ncbi:MAG: Eco57I restriction-modification methylase domain-containing protein [Nanoarchaeota archaeon]
MVLIQERNVILSKFRIDPFNKYKLNIESHDSLKFNFWNMKFDIIVGNPPYQDSEKNKKGNLWSKFIMRFFEEILKDEGFICFVTPPSWMSGTNENGNEKKKIIHKIFSKNDILYLNLDVKKYFNVGSQFSSYVIRKSNTNIFTNVISNGVVSDINLKDFLFLPKILTNISLNIINKIFNKDFPKKPFTSQWCLGYPQKEGKEKFKIHNSSGKFASSATEPKNSNIKKVIFSIPGNVNAFYDDGVYGTSINAYWMEVEGEDEANKYINAINSKLFLFLFNQCKYSGFNNILLLKNFPKISDEKDIYSYFKLDNDEIKFVEGFNDKGTSNE